MNKPRRRFLQGVASLALADVPGLAGLVLMQEQFKRLEAAFVFRRSADGDADALGKLIASHWPNDDSLLLQLLENSLTVADADEDEVGGGANRRKSHFSKCLGKELQPRGIIASRFLNVL